MNKREFVKNILKNSEINRKINYTEDTANVNFALIKYWGKSNEKLMIPSAESLSFQTKEFLGTTVRLEKSDSNILIINNEIIMENSKDYKNFFEFISLFSLPFKIKAATESNIPIASGLASSSSSFAATAKSIVKFYEKIFIETEISMLARLGSISACRSVPRSSFQKLIIEDKNTHALSFESKIKIYLGLYIISNERKKVSSRDGMKISYSSNFYSDWLIQNKNDLLKIENAMKKEDYRQFFEIVIRNSEILQDLMIKTGINYNEVKTTEIKKKIIELNRSGINIGFTQDAGANLKILSDDPNIIKNHFPEVLIFEI